MAPNYRFLFLLLIVLPVGLTAQVVESALESFNSYCQPDNSNGEVSEVADVVRRGNVAFRHRVNGVLPRRAELDDCAFHNYNPDRIYWYGFSLYPPESSFRGEDYEQYVAQWRFSNLAFGNSTSLNCEMFRECGGGSNFGGSGHHLTVNDGLWRYTVALQDPDCADCAGLDHVNIDLAPLRTNVWTDFVIEAHYSAGQDGYLNIWMQEDDDGYRLVSAYRGRTWLEFYQEGSNQRENGALGGRVMAPNHTVGLYYGSDRAAREMYSDEIRTYQEETGADGFATVSVDGVARPQEPTPVGPQNWLYEDIGTYAEAFELRLAANPRTDFPEGAVLGLSHHDRINKLDDLALVLEYGPDGSLRARNGGDLASETDYAFVTGRTDSLLLRVDPVAETYSAFVFNGAADTVTLARDYAFNDSWSGSGSLGYFTWATFGRASLAVSDVTPVFNCGPQPLEALALPTSADRFAVGFNLVLDGSNLEEAYFGLGEDAGVGSVTDLPLSVRVNDTLGIEALSGGSYATLSEQRLRVRRAYPFKLVVDQAAGVYSLSYLQDNREIFVARDYAFTGSVSQAGRTQFYLGTPNGGCLTVTDLELLDLAEAPCAERGWQVREFTSRSGNFVVDHTFQLSAAPADTLYLGLSTPRTFDGVEDLAAYLAILPDGRLLAREGGRNNLSTGIRIVPGEVYRATWGLDALSGRQSLTITNGFGQAVSVSGFVPLNDEWNSPTNNFSRLVSFSPPTGGCLLLDGIRLDPCGPVAWRSEEIPRRDEGALDLSFNVVPRGGTFGRGEIVLSSRPEPTPASTMVRIDLDSTGVFLGLDGEEARAENTYRFTSGTRLRARLTTNPAAGTYSFNVGRFDANQPIATDYAFAAAWDGSAPIYLAYRTYKDGCVEIENLVEGESCGPESWETVALRDELSGPEGRITVRLTPIGNNFRDGVWGLSHLANVQDFNDLGPIIQFGTDNLIRARDGGEYRADAEVPYVYGNTYELSLLVNTVTQRYSVFIDQDGDRLTLAGNYAFRADWTGNGPLLYGGSRTVTAGCLTAESEQLVSSTRRPITNTNGYVLHYRGQGDFAFGDRSPEDAYVVTLYDLSGRLLDTQRVSGDRFRTPLPGSKSIYVVTAVAVDRSWAVRLRFPAF